MSRQWTRSTKAAETFGAMPYNTANTVSAFVCTKPCSQTICGPYMQGELFKTECMPKELHMSQIHWIIGKDYPETGLSGKLPISRVVQVTS